MLVILGRGVAALAVSFRFAAASRDINIPAVDRRKKSALANTSLNMEATRVHKVTDRAARVVQRLQKHPSFLLRTLSGSIVIPESKDSKIVLTESIIINCRASCIDDAHKMVAVHTIAVVVALRNEDFTEITMVAACQALLSGAVDDDVAGGLVFGLARVWWWAAVA